MRILIADDHRIFAQSLAALLSNIPDFEIVGVVGNGKLALQFLEKEQIELVLSDMQMPEMSGIELVVQVRRHFPSVKVMILSMTEEVALVREAIQVGAAGFGSKSMDKDELERALRMVAQGETYLGADILRELTRQPVATRSDETGLEMSCLSEREVAVLSLISKEFSTNEIADKLFVSVNTVETHRKNLFKKLGVKNAIGLIKFALRNGLAD